MPRDRRKRRSFMGRAKKRHPLYPGLIRRERGRQPAKPLPRIVAAAFTGTLILIITFCIVVASSAYAAYAQVAASLTPRLEALGNREVFETSRIYDRNGTLLYELFDSGKRTRVSLEEVEPMLIYATIAIEDKTFFTNQGVDLEGIARALYQNLTAGAETSGASTITQQVIKNIILTDEERAYENRYQRKMTEIILAQELNDQLTKRDILEVYLNEIYYGNLAYGIEAASNVYFDASASELTLSQAALLAGLPQLPSEYDPLQFAQRDEQGAYLPGLRLNAGWVDPAYLLPEDTTAPKWRQIAVLRQMVDEGYVTEAQARRAASQELRFAEQVVPLNAPHFVFYVQRVLEERYGERLVTSGGLNIYTTLDLSMQRMVQQKAAEHITNMDARNIHNAAVVVMHPRTGQILSMVGSIDYNAIEATRTPGQEGNVLDGQVNVAVRERQPGSALKPFTYLAAMERGMTPETVLWDVPTEFPAGDGTYYAPKNYNGNWNGPVRIRTALANSLNMPAVKALKHTGVEHTLDLLDRVGIREGLNRGLENYGLALTLGGGEVTLLELTTAYSTLANEGRYLPPTAILKIEDNDGNVIEEFTQTPGDQVVDAGTAMIISNMLSDDRARQPIWGLNSRLQLSRPAAVKTGTSEDWRDAWTAGYTPYLTVGVWSGNNNNEPTDFVESLEGGGVIWANVMEELFVWMDTQPQYSQLFSEPFDDAGLQLDFRLSDDVIRRPICEIAGPFGGYREELFTTTMLNNYDQNRTATPARGQASDMVCEAIGAVAVVVTPSGGYCRPAAGQNYGSVQTINYWKMPEEEEGVKIDYSWTGGGAVVGGTSGIGYIPYCSAASFTPPRREAPPTATPDPRETAAGQLPYLIGYGENQAKGALAALGITSVVVDYQGPERLGAVFDQFPAYAVVSMAPGPGTPITPGMTVVLGIRAPGPSPASAEPGIENPIPEPAEPAPPPEPVERPQPQERSAP